MQAEFRGVHLRGTHSPSSVLTELPVYTSVLSPLTEFYNDLFKHLSLPLDCGLLKGRQPVWLTIYFYLLAQSLAHDGPVLNELLLPAVSHPSCSQPCLS